MKDIERRLSNLEKRTGSELIVFQVVEDRGQPDQGEDGDNLSREEIHAATERYRQGHPDDQGTDGILVLYFERDESGKVEAFNLRDRFQQDKAGQR